ncbi:DUF742 domain-containing protein [Streptomyces noboritoensis]|uniref:DUF742 domain-containing protein n=1 Tax=Streptomyces noboritoensis TaxID=67337 RepID=A0ABV6TCJ7_9ACTN
MNRRRHGQELVRVYVRTGGRVRPSRELGLVTLVIAANAPLQGLDVEARRIAGLCRSQRSLSIGEIAAHLNLPPSAVKILVSALIDSGHLTVPPAPQQGDAPDIDLVREVLNGLRALRA